MHLVFPITCSTSIIHENEPERQGEGGTQSSHRPLFRGGKAAFLSLLVPAPPFCPFYPSVLFDSSRPRPRANHPHCTAPFGGRVSLGGTPSPSSFKNVQSTMQSGRMGEESVRDAAHPRFPPYKMHLPPSSSPRPPPKKLRGSHQCMQMAPPQTRRFAPHLPLLRPCTATRMCASAIRPNKTLKIWLLLV